MKDFGWVLVFYADNEILVEVMTSLLEENEISACVLDHSDPRFSVFGKYEIFVREDHRTQAVAIIEQCKMNLS